MPLRAVVVLMVVAGITVAQGTPEPDAPGPLMAGATVWRLALHSMHWGGARLVDDLRSAPGVRACELLRSAGLGYEVRLEVDPDFVLAEAWPAVRVRQSMQILAAVHDGPAIGDDLRVELGRCRADDAAVRILWCRLATATGPEAVPRVVWAACAHLVARWRHQPNGLWDPRLEEVATLSTMVATHWASVGAPLPLDAGAESWGQRAQRLREALPADRELAAVANWCMPHVLALRVGAQRTAAVCDLVATHATAVAARTRYPDIAARYRDFAAACAAVVAAAAALQ